MAEPDAFFVENLVTKLLDNYDVERGVLTRLVADIWGLTDCGVEDYIRRRHAELQAKGMRNEAIYRRLAVEISQGRFASSGFSERQIRRIIYG